MTNKLYDTLNYIALIVLPALATLYFALSNIWYLPYTEQVIGTITALDTFLGMFLKMSKDKYLKNGGDINDTNN